MSKIQDNVLYSTEPYDLDSGKRRYIFHILDLVQQELKETGDRDWMIDAVEETSVRISHIKGRSMTVASGFSKLGLQFGHTLHASYSTNVDFYWPVFGGWLCGAMVSVGDPELSVEALKSQLVDTRAKIVVCTSNCVSKYIQANKELPSDKRVNNILVLDKSPWDDIPAGASSFRKLFDDDGTSCPEENAFPPYDPKEPALVNWTSGTTGIPKGVVLSQEILYFYLRKSRLPLKTNTLTTNIFFHGGGFQLPLDGGINNRFPIFFVKPNDFEACTVLKLIEKYKIQFYMCGVAEFTAVANCNDEGFDLSSLFVIMPAGGQVTETAVNKMKLKFKNLKMVYQFYGSTEVGGVSGSLTSQNIGTLR